MERTKQLYPDLPRAFVATSRKKPQILASVIRIEIDATIELNVPVGEDPEDYFKRIAEKIFVIAKAEEQCIGWRAGWEPL